MERFTSNKTVDEMSMVELAHNSCYAENRKAMYRDFETVRDAREFARELYEAYVNKELPTDDDEFDSRMIDDLQYEPTIHANGLIALFYRNLWAMADLREKLKVYEDEEEQGLLLRLPVTVGSTVYHYCGDFGVILPYTVSSICISSFLSGGIDIVIEGGAYGEDEVLDDFSECFADFKKSFFLTEAEAEQALKRMESE